MAVGTIAAWYNRSLDGLDWGRIHWVATRPAYQRRGLARAAMSDAMTRLARWHERAYLLTSSGRLGAIRIYLDFGFMPDLDFKDAVKAWRQVAQHLAHPALRAIKELSEE